MDPEMREMGTQPLDARLRTLGLENADLVEASSEQLTHKQVARARKGRRLTRRMQDKVRRAYEAASGESERLEDLFTYRGH